MDRNELERRRSVSIRNAANAATIEARIAHSQLALGYAARINCHRPKLDVAI